MPEPDMIRDVVHRLCRASLVSRKRVRRIYVHAGGMTGLSVKSLATSAAPPAAMGCCLALCGVCSAPRTLLTGRRSTRARCVPPLLIASGPSIDVARQDSPSTTAACSVWTRAGTLGPQCPVAVTSAQLGTMLASLGKISTKLMSPWLAISKVHQSARWFIGCVTARSWHSCNVVDKGPHTL